MNTIDRDRVVDVLNRLLEAELAGVVRYTHYSFLVFGFGRIPDRLVAAGAGRTNRCCTRSKSANGSRRSVPIRRCSIGRCSTRTSTTPRRCCGSRSITRTRAGAVPRAAHAGRRPLGRAGRVRAPDDLRRGAACGRGRQDAAQARRCGDGLDANELGRRGHGAARTCAYSPGDRGQRVMIDADLARLYGAEIRAGPSRSTVSGRPAASNACTWILKVASQSWCFDTVSGRWEVSSYSIERTTTGKPASDAHVKRRAPVHHGGNIAVAHFRSYPCPHSSPRSKLKRPSCLPKSERCSPITCSQASARKAR